MRSDGAREVIFRRRAHFVASALAATGVVSAASHANAQDAAADAQDAAEDVLLVADAAPEVGGRTDAGETEPQVCLCACEAVGLASGPAGLIPLAAAGLIAIARRKSRRTGASTKDQQSREAP